MADYKNLRYQGKAPTIDFDKVRKTIARPTGGDIATKASRGVLGKLAGGVAGVLLSPTPAGEPNEEEKVKKAMEVPTTLKKKSFK